jgi:hypothetical protein
MSKRWSLPSGFFRGGKPYFWRALFDVTSGGEFWMVAVGPARWAILTLGFFDTRFSLRC